VLAGVPVDVAGIENGLIEKLAILWTFGNTIEGEAHC